MKNKREQKQVMMENASYVNAVVRYLPFRSRVERQIKDGEIWVTDQSWKDPSGFIRDRADSERRAKSYATIERFDNAKQISTGTSGRSGAGV